ncbi:hypothetical protein ACWCYY_06520 [Kitasatospora sp. NPDC001664]
MYGPTPTAPAPPTPGSAVRVWLVLLRAALALIAVCSLGFLAWLPLLVPALVHRRLRDWLLFCASLAVVLGSGFLIGRSDDTSVAIAMLILLSQAALVSAYTAAVGLTRRQAPPPPAVPGNPPVWYGHPLPAPHAAVLPPVTGYALPAVPNQRRVDQVRSGLDELSAYLKQQDAP